MSDEQKPYEYRIRIPAELAERAKIAAHTWIPPISLNAFISMAIERMVESVESERRASAT